MELNIAQIFGIIVVVAIGALVLTIAVPQIEDLYAGVLSWLQDAIPTGGIPTGMKVL
jgi:hypothetical protein